VKKELDVVKLIRVQRYVKFIMEVLFSSRELTLIKSLKRKDIDDHKAYPLRRSKRKISPNARSS